MNYNPGFNISPTESPMGFKYGPGVFGPRVEIRHLNDIRKSLQDPYCDGPDQVYAIAMDVGKVEHKKELEKRMLLFGVVTYASGKLGNEPVRSQGHIHKKSSHSGWSPPEIYEIWQGKAIIYMQEHADNNPGRCFAVYAEPGDIVMVPPEWAHATISANPDQPLTFGAWCDREYGFEYEKVERTGEYAHSAAIIFLSPEGKITRYLYGIKFNEFQVRNALYEAADGNVGSTVDKIVMYCYQYDPDSNSYVPVAWRIMKLGGLATVLILGIFLGFLWLKEKGSNNDLGR